MFYLHIIMLMYVLCIIGTYMYILSVWISRYTPRERRYNMRNNSSERRTHLFAWNFQFNFSEKNKRSNFYILWKSKSECWTYFWKFWSQRSERRWKCAHLWYDLLQGVQKKLRMLLSWPSKAVPTFINFCMLGRYSWNLIFWT